MNVRASFLALALSAPWLASAPALAVQVERGDEARPSVVEEIVRLGRSEPRVQEHLWHVTQEIGPRLTSSSNLTKAGEWARQTFANWGLEARLEEWGTFPVGFDRGPWSGGMVAPEKQDFDFTTMAWTAGTDGVLRGAAVLYPETEEALEALREKLDGAWIVVPRWGRGETPERDLRKAADELLESAAIAGYVRPARGSELVLTGGRSKVDWDELPTTVTISLRGDQHEALVARLREGQAVELEFDVQNTFVEGPIPLYNVVADLVGSEKPEEMVIVCGHLDSWDGALGTVDNGTGTATTMEAARLLVAVGARPARTIRFILWSGEEQGLLGSRAYVEAHADEMDKVSAVLNHDGGTNYLAGLTVTPEMRPAFEQACAPLFDLNPDLPFELVEVDGLPNSGSSDHASFVRAGVPGFFWIQRGRSNYTYHHHTQFDTFDAAIPEYQEHSSIVAAVTAFNLANQPERLDRANMLPVPQRKMGVQLSSNKVGRVLDGRAKEAGWEVDDVIVEIDGVAVDDQRSVIRELQKGGPIKKVKLKRGEAFVETSLDYTDDPDEEARQVRRARRGEPKEGEESDG